TAASLRACLWYVSSVCTILLSEKLSFYSRHKAASCAFSLSVWLTPILKRAVPSGLPIFNTDNGPVCKAHPAARRDNRPASGSVWSVSRRFFPGAGGRLL